MGQGDSARDFGTSESMKHAGILDVFPIFHTAQLGQKIRRSPQSPLGGVALDLSRIWRLLLRGDVGIAPYERSTEGVCVVHAAACTPRVLVPLRIMSNKLRKLKRA